MAEKLLVKAWHGGKLEQKPSLHYEGGETNIFEVEVDKVSYFELIGWVFERGSYKSRDFEMYYLVPGMTFQEGLIQLNNDTDVNEMLVKLGDDVKHMLHLYCQDKPAKQPNEVVTLDENAYDESAEYDGSESDDEVFFTSDGSGSDDDDEEWTDSIAALKVDKENQLSNKEYVHQLLIEQQSDNQIVVHQSDASSYEDSEGDVNSPGESEDDDIRGKKRKVNVPVVTENTDWSKWVWVVGTRFPTRDAFRDAVRNYAVTNGRDCFVSISNKKRDGRVGVSCVDGCPFKVYVSFHLRKGCFMVKSAVNEHTCQRNMNKNRQLTAEFIANQFLPIFKANPQWPAREIQEAVKEKFKVIITKWLAYKAKGCAHKKLHGSMKEHYSKLGSYLEALKQANPTSIFELVTVPSAFYGGDSEVEVFFRLFVCFDPIKKGFLAGCRKILCLDGCFLKTFLGGMLLAAIGRDGNDQMYPVAWAVVEGENNDSWTWFMDQLKKALDVNDDGQGWTLVSDQQKGLLNAVAGIWGGAEHRNCARHIYANWHKKFKGDDLKGLFWKAARAYSETDHKKAILELRELNHDATEAFISQNPRCFCRCYLQTRTKADVNVNNMAETFNGYILKSRSKHIINMLEDIRLAVMTRLIKKQNEMAKKVLVVCPRIQMKLDLEKERAYKCVVFPSSNTLFQVTSFDEVSVDLDNRTCTCRKWNLTGIPCYHVCAVAGFLNKNAEEFVDSCYTKQTYLRSYQFTIPPMPSEKYWPELFYPLDPPPVKIGPGRPKKNRRKDPHEEKKKPGKLSRHGIHMTCTNCNKKGHNRKTCTEKKSGAAPSQVPKKRGRPRKSQAAPSQVGQASQSTQQSSQVNAPSQVPNKRGRPKKTRAVVSLLNAPSQAAPS